MRILKIIPSWKPLETKSKLLKSKEKIACKHPDYPNKWITGTIIDETAEKVLIHYESELGTEEILNIDQYEPYSDGDDWFDKYSHDIAKN